MSIKQKSLSVFQYNASILPQFQQKLKNMNHRDLQKEALILGMKPRHVCGGGHWQLVGYINEHFFEDRDKDKLLKYDLWIERKLKRTGSELVAPSLRMSYIRDKNLEEAATKPEKKIAKKVTTKKRAPRVKSDYGIVEGTKKHYVYELVRKDKNTKQIVKRTIKKYPESKENSIKIWIGKAKKLFKELS